MPGLGLKAVLVSALLPLTFECLLCLLAVIDFGQRQALADDLHTSGFCNSRHMFIIAYRLLVQVCSCRQLQTWITLAYFSLSHRT